MYDLTHYGNADHCEDSGVFKNIAGSYQILLFTLFAVLASTAFIFLGKESAWWTFYSSQTNPWRVVNTEWA